MANKIKRGDFLELQDRYQLFLARDNTSIQDNERKSLFYVLSGNYDLYTNSGKIYDFDDHSIKMDCLDNGEVDFTSGTRKLIHLAFNLYNGYHGADILDIFSSLDSDNFDLAINAIYIRFGRGVDLIV